MIPSSDSVYDCLISLRKVLGKKDKVRLLSNSFFKPYLFYAYNPHYQYGIKRAGVRLQAFGDKNFNQMTWKLLDVLRRKQLTGNKALETTNIIMRDMTYKSATLLNWILRKDLRCGIGVKLINEAHCNLIPEFEVMLAEELDPERLIFPCSASFKVDGLRGIYKNKLLYSRSGRFHNGVSHILTELKLWPIFSHIDGELVIPGRHFQDSLGRIRSYSEDTNILYYLFDIPAIKEYPFHVRYNQLKTKLKSRVFKYVKLVEHVRIENSSQLQWYYKRALQLKFEGLMIKTLDHKYQNGRNHFWMKMTDQTRADLPCIGIYRGKGKYANSLGGIVVKLSRGKTTNVGSGFSDDQRALYFTKPKLIVNKIVEILFKEKTRAGKLRHPRFVGIRTDKSV